MLSKINGYCIEYAPPAILGVASYLFAKVFVKHWAPTLGRLSDPLVLAMVLGILFRTCTSSSEFWKAKKCASSKKVMPAVALLVPFGIVFYALKNMNLVSLYNGVQGDSYLILLALAVVATYFVVVFFSGKFLKQKREITFLTMTGSAICGASAIALTSPTVEADSDDVSVSLLSVTLTAIVGLFIVIPFLSIVAGFDNEVFAKFAGVLFQFTGFVKMALAEGSMFDTFLPHVISTESAAKLGVALKSIRFPVLMLALPVLGVMAKRSGRLPIALYLFLLAGILGFLLSTYTNFFSIEIANYISNGAQKSFKVSNLISWLYGLSWSIALAAIGLSADVKKLMSFNGVKAIAMAFAGFMAATAVFLVGINLIGY